ncbi:hypothetical protein T484DRAFT_1811066 [Baffinella frigidus]|nr:hypothetical protein T484DRAFT_1811066 [Cryptophyta sp. CCMP2293]
MVAYAPPPPLSLPPFHSPSRLLSRSLCSLTPLSLSLSRALSLSLSLSLALSEQDREVTDYSPLIFFSTYTVVASLILLNVVVASLIQLNVVIAVVASLILLNVVVAVLLQNFQNCVDQDNNNIRMEATEKAFRAEDLAPLDPILMSLSAFDEPFLIERYIRLIFRRFGV